MKKLVSRLFRFALYCIGYILVINLTASFINDSLDEIDLVEVLSVKSMKAGQKDILVATRKKIENVDLESIQDEITAKLKEWEEITDEN
jgi:pentose-5-phosphate-3-epimerase